MQSSTRRRSGLARRFGWLVVAGLTTAALVGPGTGAVSAAPVVSDPGKGNPTCLDLGYALSFKIDTGDLENKAYAAGDSSVETNWAGQVITLSGLSDDGQTFNWASVHPVSAVLVKAGNDNHALYTYNPAVNGDSGLTHGAGEQGISHLLFCGNETTTTTSETTTEETTTSETTTSETTTETTSETTTTTDPTPTPTPDPTPTPTPTPNPTPTPTPNPTPTPTPNPTPTPTPEPTPTPPPTGEVLSETGAPAVTLPPTDALSGNSSTPSGDSWRLILLAMAGILAGTLLLTPSRATADKRNR